MRLHTFTTLLVGAIFSLCLANAPATAGWQIEEVESGGLVGSYTSLAFDSSGLPAITFQGNGNLECVRHDGTSWVKTTVDPAASRRQFPTNYEKGQYSCLAFDPSDNPAVSYYDNTKSSLKYARFNGTSWDTTTIDSAGDVGWHTSIAFDSSGHPAISYQDFTVPSQGNLRYASFNGVSWDITSVDYTGNNEGLYTSLAFDASDNPSISYYDDTSKDLKFARLNGGNWVIERVHNVGDIGSYTSLAIDASGNPAISYYDATNNVLKYASFNGTSWEIKTVDTAGSVGWYTSLAFDASGRPAISYYDFTTPENGNLRYASFNGTSWDVTSIDTEGNAGLYSSLAFDASGHPAIAYQGNNTLKYAHFVPETATATTTPDKTKTTEPETTSANRSSGASKNHYYAAAADPHHQLKFAGADVTHYKHNHCLPVTFW